jgi:tol-pal system protein YbgF
MRYPIFCASLFFLFSAVLPGCATPGGSQLESTVYDTHRRMVKLDNNLESSVTRLNETTAELIARVNQSDQETRQLQSMTEENQRKIEALSSVVEEMRLTLYRHFNLTPPSGYSTGSGGITIEDDLSSVQQPAARPAAETQETVPPVAASQGASAAATPPAESAYGDPKVQYQDAQKSYAREDYETALRQFTAHLAQFPEADTAGNAQFWKARCLLNLEKYQEAIQEFEKVRKNYPSSTKVPFAIHNEAVAWSRLGDTAMAEKLLQEVIENYPVSPAADQAKSDLQKLRQN